MCLKTPSFESTATGAVYKVKLPDDPRYWHANKTVSYRMNRNICVPSSMPAGTYALLLNLPDPKASLAARADYSIRLANLNSAGSTIWESATGYNNLLKSITVSASAASSPCASSPVVG